MPERLARSLSGIVAGTVREVGAVVLPARVRRTRLYSAVVGATLQFLIEQVAEIKQSGDVPLPNDFIIRKAAGNVVDIAGIAMFHFSPVWILAALSDVAGMGSEFSAEISHALREAGLLKTDHSFSNVNELLNGLEMTSAQMAKSIQTPPLAVGALRQDWENFCREAARIPEALLPKPEVIWAQWNALKQEAARQERSVAELSTVMAISAFRALPQSALWLSRAAKVSGHVTGEMLARDLFDHYKLTLAEIHSVGYLQYWMREFQPYFSGALQQFSLKKESMTERLLNSVWK